MANMIDGRFAEAYNDHYRWADIDHPSIPTTPFTLKADPDLSFQPQDSQLQLIDIVLIWKARAFY